MKNMFFYEKCVFATFCLLRMTWLATNSELQVCQISYPGPGTVSTWEVSGVRLLPKVVNVLNQHYSTVLGIVPTCECISAFVLERSGSEMSAAGLL